MKIYENVKNIAVYVYNKEYNLSEHNTNTSLGLNKW